MAHEGLFQGAVRHIEHLYRFVHAARGKLQRSGFHRDVVDGVPRMAVERFERSSRRIAWQRTEIGRVPVRRGAGQKDFRRHRFDVPQSRRRPFSGFRGVNGRISNA